VVLVVVDGLPAWQLAANREAFVADGFRRLLDRGAWYEEAGFSHAHTVTAPGHAVMLTGAYPDRTGIVGNEWVDPASGRDVYSASDAAHRYIGETGHRGGGTSPANLRVETLGDVLRRLEPRSRVVAVSGKDRGAIFTAGHAGTAYVYRGDTGRFASTTYYMARHPAWVAAFDAARPSGASLDELTLAFAKAAIEGGQLGRDDAPDILSVSLSWHDAVNHRFGAESAASKHDLIALDRLLQDFFRHLDAAVGEGRYVIALTSDHGFAPTPESSRALGRDAGRIDLRAALAQVNSGLEAAFGPGRWIRGAAASGIVFDRPLAASRGVGLDRLAEEARNRLLAQPGFAAAFTRRELASASASGAPYFDSVRRSWDAERSPDLVYVTRPWWIPGGGSGTTHGSPHPYDTHVPLLLYGPRWVTSGRVHSRVDVADLAPTLALLLGVPPPSASEGQPLPLPR
jgi:hypothetical protein